MPHFTAARPADRAKPLSLDSLGCRRLLIALELSGSQSTSTHLEIGRIIVLLSWLDSHCTSIGSELQDTEPGVYRSSMSVVPGQEYFRPSSLEMSGSTLRDRDAETAKGSTQTFRSRILSQLFTFLLFSL